MSEFYQKDDLKLSRLGLGCMRMSTNLDSSRKESLATIREAVDLGVNLIDTGDFYGEGGHNEKLIGEALKDIPRDDVFLSVKYGTFNNLMKGLDSVDVGPTNVKKYVTSSLKNLGVDSIDLYQPARVDIGIPIEDTIGALVELVDAGYIRHIGLSQVDSETLRKANAIHPIKLVELEYSIVNKSIESDLLPTARELGIGVVAFGAMGFGKLSQNGSESDILIKTINDISKEKDITFSQLVHAWLYNRGEDIIPLIGSRTRDQFDDTFQCKNITFSKDENDRINRAFQGSSITGPGMPNFIIKNGKLVR
ncbi:aldo/keto reductase [Halosquirtibacter xylanolyticus]|uniref:aldo/keto reductase n=1 Tax=Halosquirtibacter xylanolyticus TaxID=3374599 RepID=UPI003748F76A|nr:aldo/keto reductase [Prolixibacteraceae bacterium]